ncbi:MAG: LON peptidase substrate-binding domain-containing protein, partial [Mailhella sp.]|nr:LON peptidase substrate-binding domain-containing protein [Mailhella sp.]
MSEQTTLELPVITLREVVMFPRAVMTFHVGRAASVNAINSAVTEYDKQIFLVAQTNPSIERPGLSDLFTVGVVSRIQRVERLQDGTLKVVCEGLYRANWLPLNSTSHFGDRAFPRLRTVRLTETLLDDLELPAVVEALQETLSEATRQNRRITPEQLATFALIEEPGALADAVAPVLKVDYLHKQNVLEMLDQGERLRQVYQYLGGELITSRIDKTVKSRVKAQMEQNQREYYLTEQIKAIHKELGHDDIQAELLELEEQLKAKNMPEEPREKALRELHKLRQMQPGSAEYVVGRNYVDWILDLPWNDLKDIDIDIDKARGILDDGHYGLEKAKTRILEYLAVQKLSGALKGPILCLVGPPGVGKTSLARSIAEATGREFVRISLG